MRCVIGRSRRVEWGRRRYLRDQSNWLSFPVRLGEIQRATILIFAADLFTHINYLLSCLKKYMMCYANQLSLTSLSWTLSYFFGRSTPFIPADIIVTHDAQLYGGYSVATPRRNMTGQSGADPDQIRLSSQFESGRAGCAYRQFRALIRESRPADHRRATQIPSNGWR